MKYNIQRNDYSKNKKKSTIYTPKFLVDRIWNIIKDSGISIDTILDPSVGEGALINHLDCTKVGVDIENREVSLNKFILNKYQHTTKIDYDKYNFDLVIINPPFNGHPSRKLYPEIFLKHTVKLFGDVPIVMITPPTLRLNQRLKSDRWKWIDKNVEISSILTLPIDIFKDVLFHSEVIFFNFPRNKIKPHYFLLQEDKETDIFSE